MEQEEKRKRRSKEEVIKEMSTRERLSEKFPDKCIKRRLLGQGTSQEKVIEYIGGDKVIDRLNSVFDLNWNFTISDKIVDVDIGQIAILGRLTVCYGDKTIVKEQWGSSAIETYTNGRVVSLGDNIKAATTDSLKKCASLIGVGLYLYDSESEKFSNPSDALPAGKEKEDKIAEIVEKVNRKASKAQVSTIIKIIKDNEILEEDVKRRYNVESFSDMSGSDAAEFIVKGKEMFSKIDMPDKSNSSS